MLLVSILFIDSIHPDSRCHDLSLYVCEAELFSADYLPVMSQDSKQCSLTLA
jgi:hypothetical protein